MVRTFTVVSLITLSNMFSSTSVKIWSSSGINLALLWEKNKKKRGTSQHKRSTTIHPTPISSRSPDLTSGRSWRCWACCPGRPGGRATCVALPPWRTCLCTGSWAATASLGAPWWWPSSLPRPSTRTPRSACRWSAPSPRLTPPTGIPPGTTCPAEGTRYC